jgi:hypothetical protein
MALDRPKQGVAMSLKVDLQGLKEVTDGLLRRVEEGETLVIPLGRLTWQS